MTSQPPPADAPEPAPPDETLAAIGGVSLRLMAGAVPRRTMDALKRTVLSSPDEYPWRAVNRVVLEAPVDEQDLAQRGLKAQRDWILRGGRENPGKSLSVHAKTWIAKLLTQLIFLTAYSLVVVVLLLILKHKWPTADIYRLLAWTYEAFPNLVPK
jgi:hypothetical protein